MKNAYLIIAHHNWEQLKRFIRFLDSESNDFYIHVNKTVEKPYDSFFQGITVYSKVYFTKRFDTAWATSAFLKAELCMLKTAMSTDKYDYFHLLSGDDLPLKNGKYINDFLQNNLHLRSKRYKTNYISVRICDEERKLDRIRYWHPFFSQQMKQTVIWGRYLRHISKWSLFLQHKFGYDRFKRIKNLNYHFFGSSWWSISDEFAKYILGKEKFIRKYFIPGTVIPDEAVMQILVMNSEFMDSVYLGEEKINSNLRDIVWEQIPSDHPKTFTIADKDYLLNSNNLFARKFNSELDSQIIDEIYNHLNSSYD